VERFDIDDELMNNEQTASEQKVAEMKKVEIDKNNTIDYFYLIRFRLNHNFHRYLMNKHFGILKMTQLRQRVIMIIKIMII
jgi:hypothetical protein